MEKYLMIGRSAMPTVQDAGRELVERLNNTNELLIVSNIIFMMDSRTHEGRTYRIPAITQDVNITFDGMDYKLTYEKEHMALISVFVYILDVIREFNKKAETNKKLAFINPNDETLKVLDDILSQNRI